MPDAALKQKTKKSLRKGVKKMKKFTKLFLSCAAVAAVTAAVASSAMAAEVDLKGDFTGKYDTETGVVTFTAPDGLGDTTTLLVVDGTLSSVSDETILGIDQAASISSVKLDTAKVTDLENKTYTVALGGTKGVVKTATFGKASAGFLMGDVDFNEDVDLDDASLIVGHSTKKALLSGDALLVADVDENDDVDLDDASCIVAYVVKKPAQAGVAGQIK